MLCQTILKTNKPIEQLTRDDIQCKIVYVAEGFFWKIYFKN